MELFPSYRLKEGDKQPSSQLESLPHDLIHYVLSRVPTSSLVQFKSVCRGWRMLAQDLDSMPHFHSDCTTRDQLYFVDFPACNHEDKKVKRFHVLLEEAMPEFNVLGSSNGLLCLSDSLQNDALYVYNPFIGNYQHLPKSAQYRDQRVVFRFGFNSTTNEYKVLKIIYYRKACTASGFNGIRDSEVQILTLGSSTWRSLGKAGYHLYQLHWVTWPRRLHRGTKIISFDLENEQLREVPSTTLKGYDYHLVSLGGCLSAAVYFNHCKLEIWVMKEYDVDESWIKRFNIKAYNGEILLEYESRALVSYDPKGGEFKDLMFQGIPRWYQTVVYMGSFKWIDTFTDA
ncbi:hypothetical protein CIPAW_03G156100 [Carya illinoinensis]|uniref:F-box domain-containing protein n=1 Tax=Carya illinoinensis TaxID=32201 RepID=A0A8T1R2U1_CARIL|nr:hypothetical protein CIPAW_03G156100 [Carya illinoinensis]